MNRSKTKNCSEETRQSRIPPTSSGGGSSAVGHQPFLERTVQQTRTRIGLLCFSVRYDFSRFYFGILSIFGPPRPEFVCWRAEESKEEHPLPGQNLIDGFGDVNFLFHPRVFEAGGGPGQRNRETGKPICRRGHHARRHPRQLVQPRIAWHWPSLFMDCLQHVGVGASRHGHCHGAGFAMTESGAGGQSGSAFGISL